MTHHVTMKTNYSCKKTFHRKSDVRFFAIIFFLTTCAMKNFFASFFLFTHFCVKKNIAKKSIHHTLLENLFFVIETVLYLSVTTFFECEMNISFILYNYRIKKYGRLQRQKISNKEIF